MRTLSLSSERFEAFARSLSEFSASYLQRLPQLPTYPPGITGLDTERLFAGDAPAEGIGDEAFHALASIFEHSRPASPRFFGYVFGSGEPIGMLGEFAAAVLHQNVTAWRSAPSAVTIERTVVRWLADAIGCNGYTGSLTLGGSSANLMGLCIAREAKAPANQSGTRSGSVLYCSSEAHMSIQKAAALLGFGHEAVRLIEVDEMFRMPMERLRQAIVHDLQNGRTPIAVVASAGTTTTGSIDRLAEVADHCQEFDLVPRRWGLRCLCCDGHSRSVSRIGARRLDLSRSPQMAVPANRVWVLTLPCPNRSAKGVRTLRGVRQGIIGRSD